MRRSTTGASGISLIHKRELLTRLQQWFQREKYLKPLTDALRQLSFFLLDAQDGSVQMVLGGMECLAMQPVHSLAGKEKGFHQGSL